MRSGWLAIFFVVLLSCGSNTGTSSSSPSPALGANPLFGDWRWTRSCEAVVEAFEEAGLTDRLPQALVDARYVASADAIEPDDPCAGAEETGYLYFFEDPDRWGLIDDDDVLVEDREFTVVDDDTIAFDVIELDRRIEGDTMTFEVRRPATCNPACLETYAWVLATFAPATLERAS